MFFYEYEPSFMKDMAFTLPLLLALIVIPIIKKNIKWKILNSDIIYVIILTCAFSIVFGDIFLILIILHLLGMEMNAYLGYLFFLLFGLWGGSAIALSATSYMKKINHEELGKKQNSKDS